jgi:uncharacterized protein YbjT (DUF2867 family)
MKLVIIGGTGRIGSNVVARLRKSGHEAVPASPDTGVDTITGKGLAEVLAGADVVVDVSNSPSFEDEAVLEFFTTSTRNLLAAAMGAEVRHYVALSVVGADRLTESGYMRAKAAQEKLIRGAPLPYSMVHATQFFEFIDSIADGATVGTTVHIAPVLFQPMAADDVAEAVAEVAAGPPLNGVMEIAGPQQFRFDELIGETLAERGDLRTVVADPQARYFGAILSERSLVPARGAQLGKITLEKWRKRATRRTAGAGR